MNAWSVSEAKAKLSAVLASARRAPQLIENRGEPVAVVLSPAEYERLTAALAPARPGAMQRWLEESARLRGAGVELELPRRGDDRTRPLPFAADGE